MTRPDVGESNQPFESRHTWQTDNHLLQQGTQPCWRTVATVAASTARHSVVCAITYRIQPGSCHSRAHDARVGNQAQFRGMEFRHNYMGLMATAAKSRNYVQKLSTTGKAFPGELMVCGKRHSSGFLSSRRPRKTGCRSFSSSVHSSHATWATSFGTR